jgi:hypothetical protein
MKFALALAGALFFSSCATPKKVDREEIRSVFKAHMREIRDCYEQRLKEKTDLEGKLVIEFDIMPGGKVDSPHFVEESSTLKDAPMRECFLSKVVTWDFPEPPNGQIVQVAYPYHFSASEGGAVELGNHPK